MSVRSLPWLLAVAGLAILLIASGFKVWALVAVWGLVLAAVWAVSRRSHTTRRQRILAALALLPILFLLVFEGGWYVIPADVAWLVIELVSRGQVDGEPIARDRSV
jgi:hypothetical protein